MGLSTLSPTLLFRAGGVLYGCDLPTAQEIVPLRAATRLPGAPPFVRGLINVRGTIVTVLDLGLRLDAARPTAEDGSILLVRYKDKLVGVTVDEVVDVRGLEIDESRATEAGGAIVHGMASVVGGEGSADGEGAVVVLDLEALIRQVLLS